ncbi:hypothetical protein L1887_08314 [Cichorium endivia]|nr:hypothetical protein L1887_08314 [Cichorium endivia]
MNLQQSSYELDQLTMQSLDLQTQIPMANSISFEGALPPLSEGGADVELLSSNQTASRVDKGMGLGLSAVVVGTSTDTSHASYLCGSMGPALDKDTCIGIAVTRVD